MNDRDRRWYDAGRSEGYRQGVIAMRGVAVERCQKQAEYYRTNEMYPAFCLNGMEAGAIACGEVIPLEADRLIEEKP